MTAIAADICVSMTGPFASAHPAGTFPGSFGILGSGWLSLSLLALLASLLILVTVYIFANFLRNQQLLSWTKFELFQILGTAIIILFGMGWVIGMCNFKMDFLNDATTGINYTGQNFFDIIDHYFGRMEQLGGAIFAQLMWLTKIIGFLQKITYFSSPLGLGMTDNPLDSLGQLNSVMFFMVSGFVTSYLLFGLQARIVEYMGIAILTYLFPFGIFFRAFEPTRGFGGALVGISLAFFLFYPITIIFNDYIMRASLKDIQAELDANNKNANDQVKSGNVPDDASKVTNPSGLAKQDIFDKFVSAVGGGVLAIIKPFAFYAMAAVVLPVINFIVLVEITRGLTKLMGEELDVSNLTRLI